MNSTEERERRRAERERRRLDDAERWYRSSRFRDRRARRALVVVGAAATSLLWAAAVVCWFLAPSELAMWATFALAGVALVVAFLVISVIAAATRGMVERGDVHLDERQRAERHRVYLLAHRGSTWLLVGTGLLVMTLSGKDDLFVEIPSAAIAVFAFAVLMTHLALPHLIAGWRAPDPLPDDED
ncbi:hypothetical protein [Planomonospora algeriensis]